MSNQPTLNRAPAVKFGIIAGLIAGLIDAAIVIVQRLASDPVAAAQNAAQNPIGNSAINLGISVLICMITPAIFILSGFLAGQASRAPERGQRSKIGLLSGLIAGGITTLIALIMLTVDVSNGTMDRVMTETIRAAPPEQRAIMSQMMTGGLMNVTAIMILVCSGIFNMLLCLGMGAAGGALSPEPKPDSPITLTQ